MNLLQLSVTVQWFVGDFSTSLEMTCLDARHIKEIEYDNKIYFR